MHRVSPRELSRLSALAVLTSVSLVLFGCNRDVSSPAGPPNLTPSFQIVPGSGMWTTKTPMGVPRDGLGGGVVNGVLYAVGGNNFGTFVETVEAYDPSTDAWTTKTSMPTPRGDFVGVGVVNGVLYAVGGMNNGFTQLGTVEAYDPGTNAWSTKASMPTPRSGLAVGVVNGVLYAVGGYTSPGNNPSDIVGTVQAYDPSTDTWTTKSSMPTPRKDLAVGVVNGVLYAVGGYDGGFLGTVEAYNPGTDTWTTKASLPVPRYGSGVGVVNGVLYAVSGYNGSMLSTVDAYDPATDTWTSVASLPAPQFAPAVGVVNGSLYVMGGSSSPGNFVAAVEAFTPAAASTGPVSRWPGDGSANDVVDGNDGTLENGATFASGRVGQAFLLDGIDDYVDVGNAPNLQVSGGDFTVDAWVLFNSLSSDWGGDESIVDKMSANGVDTDGWRLLKQVDNRFWFCFGGGSGNRCYDPAYTLFSTTHAVTGVWYHVAAVKSSGSFSLYVNGVLEDTRSPVPAFLDSHSANLRFGSYILQGAHLNGEIDEPEIYNRALSGVEIAALYHTGNNQTITTGLLGYWPFEGTANDASGNGRNLSLFGGAGFGPGLLGQALVLPGNNDSYAQQPTNDPAFDLVSGDNTVQVWFNTNINYREQALIEKWTGCCGPGGWTYTTASLSLGTVTTGVWHQIVTRQSGNTGYLFFDGSLRGFGPSGGVVIGSPNPLLIGKRDAQDGRDFSFDGSLDEIAIWNRALSDAEIARIWNGGNGTRLLMSKADQTISFGTLSSHLFSEPPFAINASAASGLPVTFSASGSCTVSGNIVSLTGAGACTITADQAGDASFNPAPSVVQSFSIAKATPLITWNPPSSMLYGQALGSTQLNATATGVGGVSLTGTFSYAPPAGTILNPGPQPLGVSFTPDDQVDYSTAAKSVSIAVLYNTAVGHGFLQPINTPPQAQSVFKIGSTIPVKFQLFLADGVTPVSTAVATIQVNRVSNSAPSNVNETVTSTVPNQGITFRYDVVSQQYIFNLGTKGWTSGTYAITALLNDGSNISVNVGVR